MIEKDLRERIVKVDESQTLTIFMTFQPTGWVRFNIDGQLGALAIQSDWGDWQHVWGGGPKYWGFPTFVEFLKNRPDYHYLVDKLHYGGRTRKVIDGDATTKAMRERVCRARLGEVEYSYDRGMRHVPKIDRARSRELWAGIDEFVSRIEDKPWDDHVWVALRAIDEECYCSDFGEFFVDVHELIQEKDHPRLVFLRDQLLPLMVAHLRGDLRVEQPAAQ